MTRKQTFCLCGICAGDPLMTDTSYIDVKLADSIKGMDETWQRYHLKCWDAQ